ncbi:MAG: hypothetical protein WCI43_01250 [Candidatus Firestonebacteria bacterium]
MKAKFLFVLFLLFCIRSSAQAANIKSAEKLTEDGNYTCAVWSPDGTKFFALQSKTGLVLFDASGRNRKALKDGYNDITKPSWSFDGNKIISECTGDQSLLLFDLVSEKAYFLEEINAGTGNMQVLTRVFGPCFSADNDNIYHFYWRQNHGTTESQLRQYALSAKGWDKITEMIMDRRNYGNMAVSPKGGGLVFMRDLMKELHTLYSVNLETGKKKLVCGDLKGGNPSWSPDGKYIYTGAELVNPAEKTAVKNLPESVLASWSSDSKRIVGVEKGTEGAIFIYDIETGKKEILQKKDLKAAAVSFTADGKKAVCVDAKDGNLFLLTIEY